MTHNSSSPDIVELVTNELLAHGEFSSIPDRNRTNAAIAALAIVEMVRASQPATPTGGEAVARFMEVVRSRWNYEENEFEAIANVLSDPECVAALATPTAMAQSSEGAHKELNADEILARCSAASGDADLAKRYTDACFNNSSDGASWLAVNHNMVSLIQHLRDPAQREQESPVAWRTTLKEIEVLASLPVSGTSLQTKANRFDAIRRKAALALSSTHGNTVANPSGEKTGASGASKEADPATGNAPVGSASTHSSPHHSTGE